MDKEKKETICAVVVTYNRKNLLLECLESLLKQTYPLDAIYIIDNASTDGTPQALKKKGYIKEILNPETEPLESENTINMLSKENQDKKVKIHYVRMHKNTGGAGGFHEGVKRGYKKGYDWLWLMDDDCNAEKRCLEKMVACSMKKKVILTPFVLTTSNEPVWRSQKFCGNKKEIRSLPFNGFLIHKEIIKEIGYPMRELFIYGDDVEYSLRARKYGCKLFVIRDAILFHPPRRGNLRRTLVILNKALLYHVEFDDRIRLYYYLRNKIAIFIFYKKHYMFFSMLREELSSILFSDSRSFFIKTFFNAVRDAFKLVRLIRERKRFIKKK